MGRLVCGATLLLLLAALASCGGGGGENSAGLPTAAPPTTSSASTQNKSELDDQSLVQGLSAVQADSLGGVTALSAQGRDSLGQRLQNGTDSGSVSAPFVLGGNPDRYLGSQSTSDGSRPGRYLLIGADPAAFDSNVLFGRLTQSEQAASGAMVRLNDATLTGTSATQEIHGNASFALGRWMTGTVTRGSGKSVALKGDDRRAYHYLAFNEVPNIPNEGSPSLTCNSGVFSTPTYLDSGSGEAPVTGTATGSATISFGPRGAQIEGAITVTAGGGAGTVRLINSMGFSSPASMIISVINLDNITGNWTVAYMLGDGDSNGSMMIAVRYIAVMLPSRARYIGVAKLSCGPRP